MIIHKINPIKLNSVVRPNAVNNPNNIAIATEAVTIVADKAITAVIIVPIIPNARHLLLYHLLDKILFFDFCN